MQNIKIPLIHKNHQVLFDIEQIESRQFILKALDLDPQQDFIFKSFGFCRNTSCFFIILEFFGKDGFEEIIYEFSLNEFNEEFYIDKIHKLDSKEEISCELSILS